MNFNIFNQTFSLSFQIWFRCNSLFSPIIDNLVEPIILTGNSNQRQCHKTLPLNFKNQSQILLIALLLKSECSFFFALPILTRVDPTKIGHNQRYTFLQFFGLLFRYHQTVEMPASTNHFDKIFYTFFYRFFFCFGAKSRFHHFFIVFWDLLTRSYFFILQIMPTISLSSCFHRKKG